MQAQPVDFLERFRLRMARTVFKGQVKKITEGLSAEELGSLAEIPGSVANILSRQARHPTPVPVERLTPEQQYIHEMGMEGYLELINQVSPAHAAVLMRHPVFAEELLEGIISLLIKK